MNQGKGNNSKEVLNKHFTRKEIWMANKHIKRWSTLATKKIQIIYHFICMNTHTHQCGYCKSWWEDGTLEMIKSYQWEDQFVQLLWKRTRHCLGNLTHGPYLYKGYILETLFHMWTMRYAQKCSLHCCSESQRTNNNPMLSIQGS